MSRWIRQSSTGKRRLVVVELDAGTAIPTVRSFSETMVRECGARLVRLNARDAEVPDGQLGLPLGALAGLEHVAALLPT